MPDRLELAGVGIAYGGKKVVEAVSFRLDAGHIGCLLGPSGCGKTSLLRAIAGFEPVVGGDILIDGIKVSSRQGSAPPESRQVGVVFQDYALFPHLNLEQNVAFGLRKLSRQEADRRVSEALTLVGLIEEGKRYPHQLSGGQQQRVALARAIAPKPRLLLIDEPFSNLDADLRERLALEVRDILKEAEMTAVLVTHDQNEAFAMADEIGVMAEGQLLQWGDAQSLYLRPANRFVANFIGQGSILEARFAPGLGLNTALGRVVLGDIAPGVGQALEVLVRPNQVDLMAAGDRSANAEVARKAFRGVDMLYTLRLLESGEEVLATAPAASPYAVGDRLHASLGYHRPIILHS
ncbi:MAG: ABC transporter ATP-binding protein [Methylococcaceae bacterium]|nr:ABC transporter ATP-binding protein [Methylococcaceae bacterium]